MGKKKYRIHWGRVAMLLAALIAIGIAIYYAIVGIIAFFSWIIGLIVGPNDTETLHNESIVITVSPEKQKETNAMKKKIEKFMAQPTRLEKKNIAVDVFDLTTQQQVYSYQKDRLFVPASCMKIPVAIAALESLGMDHKYNTALYINGTIKNDTLFGTLMLKAEADPVTETLKPLCEKIRQKGIKHIRGNIHINLALKDRLIGHPSTKAWDIPYNRTPLLLKGSQFVNNHLIYSLRAAGVTYRKDDKIKPQGKFSIIAKAESSLLDAVIPMMRNSSNIRAEAVLYHLDWKHKLVNGQQRWDIKHVAESFWRKKWLNDSIMPTKGFVFNDGSGLSPQNRLSAASLTYMLRYAYSNDAMKNYFIEKALATPGSERRGSLLSRLSQREYRNRIFCKTGTMTTIGASSLAGYIQGDDKHWYVFTIINVDSPVAEARLFQDRLCKTIMNKQKKK